MSHELLSLCITPILLPSALGGCVSAKHIYSVATPVRLCLEGMLEGDCKPEGESSFSFLLPLSAVLLAVPFSTTQPHFTQTVAICSSSNH